MPYLNHMSNSYLIETGLTETEVDEVQAEFNAWLDEVNDRAQALEQ